MGITEKIAEIEAEMARTQKNKATEFHLGLLRGKLARLRTQLIEGQSTKGPKGEGFEVERIGHARVALIGFPSVGKSTFLGEVTETKSDAAAYEFTTLTCIPGILHYKDAQIQVLDLPGIIEGAAAGKGRGRQVIAVARNADMILMFIDASRGALQKVLLTRELEEVGIRLNQRPPAVSFRRKATGGLLINSTVPLTHLNDRLVAALLRDYKIHNAEVLIREDCTVEQFLDVVEGNRRYLPCLYCYNKADMVTLEEVQKLARSEVEHTVLCSLEWHLGIEEMKVALWQHLDLLRVYTKPKGSAPDLTEPLIMRRGATIKDVCRSIHRDMADKFRYALVWGRSAKHRPQRVGLAHFLADEDVVQLVAKGD